MKTQNKFLIIDDDDTATLLYSLILMHALGDKINVKCFNLPNDGVNYINDELKDAENLKIVLFLDINMPILTGWDVLDLIDKMHESIKKQLIIFMLSSSINPNDKMRATAHPLVADFIEKPLTVEIIQDLVKLGEI